jgi:molybdopterin/thiamine biosynthesis adenylyltransferase
MLSDRQIDRYSRQIILPQLGGRGQETLLAASIAIVGSAAISTAAALYLAGAGVGRLALSAAPLVAIDGLNPDCRTSALPTLVTRAVADEVAGCDAVLVCAVASAPWQMLNAACVAQHTPLAWGEAVGSRGVVAAFSGHRPDSLCSACVRMQAAQWLSGGEACDGLADATAAFVGTLLATEAFKMLIGLGAAPAASLLTYDAGPGAINDVAFSRDPRCRTCGAPAA